MITINKLTQKMIPAIVDSFRAANWPKPSSTFETYLEEQDNEQRIIWVAFSNDAIAGYITLSYASLYPPFQEQNITEVMDFNVLPAFRKQGIGTTLLKLAEQKALETHHAVGLGVGLYADYGQALKLYSKHGYQPDGCGVTYHYKPVAPGANVCLDDDLVLWFTKSRTKQKAYTPQSIKNAPHFSWGDKCDGWWLHQTDKFTVISERMPPNTTEEKHYHSYTEQFFYCLEGELWIETNHAEFTLKPDDGLNIPANVVHTVKNKTAFNTLFLVISVPNSHDDRINCENDPNQQSDVVPH